MDSSQGHGKACSEPIIDAEMLASALKSVREGMSEDRKAGRSWSRPLSAEPILEGFLDDQLTTLAGKMGICGSRRKVVQGVHSDVSFLLNVTFEIVRQGYRRLYEEFLPNEEGESLGPTATSETPNESGGEEA